MFEMSRYNILSENIVKIIGRILFLLGFSIIIFCKIDGINLTEGQAFLNYLPLWILAVGCLLGGSAIISNSEKHK